MTPSPKLLVVAAGNFLRAYSGVKYLSQALINEGIEVEVHAPIPPAMLDEVQQYPFPIYSYTATWSGQWPRLANVLYKIYLFRRGLLENCGLLVLDLAHFHPAVMVKKLKPRTPLIHYCQELLIPEEHPHHPTMRKLNFYARHANAPDLIIDVEPHRAAKRIERFQLTKKVLVLPNTLPISEIPPPAPPDYLARLAGGELPHDRPILIYTGAVHAGVRFEVILEALTQLTLPIFFLAFCHGDPQQINQIRQQAEIQLGPQRSRICNSIPRDELLSCLHEADAGLVYYPYAAERSTNQRYPAPTKMFEYIAVGLPVVGSANMSLIRDKELGTCATDDTAKGLKTAIEQLFTSSKNKTAIQTHQKQLFATELCFEQVSAPTIHHIKELLFNRVR